jgi:hypothetical protein
LSALTEALESIHDGMARELLRRIEDGSATAADLNVALNLLKHNGVTSVPGASKPISNLASKLPFSTDESTAFN